MVGSEGDGWADVVSAQEIALGLGADEALDVDGGRLRPEVGEDQELLSWICAFANESDEGRLVGLEDLLGGVGVEGGLVAADGEHAAVSGQHLGLG